MLAKFMTLLLMLMHFGVVYAAGENDILVEDRESKVATMTMKFNEYLYEIQPDTSKIEFRVDSPVGDVWVSFDDFKGRFAMLKNGMQYDPAIVDINADSLDTSAGFIGMLLRSESFFDVERFPSMRFVGSSLEWYSDTQAVLKGNMTVQNVTRPVAFYVELVDKAAGDDGSERISVRASTTIRRSAFGIHTLLPIVGDDVNLYLNIDGVRIDTAATMLSEL